MDLGVNFDARFIIIVVMGIVLMGWVIFCAVKFFMQGRDLILKSGYTVRVKCEKCGTVYEAGSEELAKPGISKSRSVTRTKRIGTAFVNRPQYSYYAKKFECPCCGKRRFAQVLNINELNDMVTGATIKTGIRWLIIMAAGGLIILAAAAIPMHFANRAVDKQIEELKQQRYEDFKEQYGL